METEKNVNFGGIDFVPLVAQEDTTNQASNQLSNGVARTKKIKLSVSELAQLHEELGLAIIAQDADEVSKLLARGAKPTGHIQGMRISALAIQHFNENVMNFLVGSGMALAYSDTLARQAVENDNVAALRWLCASKDGRPSMYAVNGLFKEGVSKRSMSVVEFFVCEYPKLGQHKIDLDYIWDSKRILDFLWSNQKLDVLEDVFGTFKTFKSGSADPLKSHTEIYQRPFMFWLLQASRTFTYEQCVQMQKAVANHPRFAAQWKNAFPINVAHKNTNSNQAKDFVDLLVLIGAPAVEKLVSFPEGLDAVHKRLLNPSVFDSFYTNAPRSVSREVVRALLPYVENWHDNEGNNLGHLMMKVWENKATFDEVYSLCPQWLLEENNHGQTPLASLDEDVRSYAEDRLLRRTLNDAKVGLRHNRTKKQARRM